MCRWTDLHDRWQQQATQMLAVTSIKLRPELQPRAKDCAALRERARLERDSADHVAAFRQRRENDSSQQLEPIIVAELRDGSRAIVDGHHRWKGYELARRDTVPAKVLTVSIKDAVMVSKLVNLTGAKLRLTSEQQREAAWQYLAAITQRGLFGPELSLRKLGSLLGVSYNTVRTMLGKMEYVRTDSAGWSPSATDPGTGWPRWQHVKGNAWRSQLEEIPIDKRRQLKVERCAVAMYRELEKLDAEEQQMLAMMIRHQQNSTDPDELRRAAALDGIVDALTDSGGTDWLDQSDSDPDGDF